MVYFISHALTSQHSCFRPPQVFTATLLPQIDKTQHATCYAGSWLERKKRKQIILQPLLYSIKRIPLKQITFWSRLRSVLNIKSHGFVQVGNIINLKVPSWQWGRDFFKPSYVLLSISDSRLNPAFKNEAIQAVKSLAVLCIKALNRASHNYWPCPELFSSRN